MFILIQTQQDDRGVLKTEVLSRHETFASANKEMKKVVAEGTTNLDETYETEYPVHDTDKSWEWYDEDTNNSILLNIVDLDGVPEKKPKEKYEVFSRELGMYVNKENGLTENEEDAMVYDTFGEAMERASLAMQLGNVFRVYSFETDD